MVKSIGLQENTEENDPFIRFDNWYRERLESGVSYPDSFSLGTSSKSGTVSVRTVLLKGWDDSGFVFFTNYKSKKGIQIGENNKVAMLFYWPESGRQVRIEGIARKISRKDSLLYFNSRPPESRIGAWASNQSKVIPGRDYLESRFRHFSGKFTGKDIPKPPHWGGYKIVPVTFEFWQEGEHRLHHRICFTSTGEGWKKSILAP